MHRFCAESSDVDRHFQQIIQLRCVMKVAFEMNAWEPDVKFVKHDAVWQPNRTKQLRFGKFEETNVRPIEDDAGGVYIAPPYTLFDCVFLKLGHSAEEGRSARSALCPHWLVS